MSEEQEKKDVDEQVESILDDVVEEKDDVMTPYTPEEAETNQPVYGSELWHNYVMQQFRDDELMDGAPTCDGCRRVIEEVIGPITQSIVTHVTPPSVANNGTSTVAIRIMLYVTNEYHPCYKQNLICEEVADVNRDNCDPPYHKYTSATAASRAEGRALRKLLRLRNITTAEEISQKAETEVSDCEWVVDEPITDSQINVIDMICSRLDISVMDFISSGKKIYTEVESVTKSVAQRMIQELNKIQREAKKKPKSVGPYKPNWRKK